LTNSSDMRFVNLTNYKYRPITFENVQDE